MSGGGNWNNVNYNQNPQYNNAQNGAYDNQYNTGNSPYNNQYNSGNYPYNNNQYNSGVYNNPYGGGMNNPNDYNSNNYPPNFTPIYNANQNQGYYPPPPNNYPPPVYSPVDNNYPVAPNQQGAGGELENKYRSTWVAPVSNAQRRNFAMGIKKPSEANITNSDNVVANQEVKEEEEEEDSSDELEFSSDSDSDLSSGSSSESGSEKKLKKKSSSFLLSARKKKSAAYLLAAGPPRVCDACMTSIYCGDLPFPDGKKPKKKKMSKMVSQETSKAKEKKKLQVQKQKTQEKLMKEKAKEEKKDLKRTSSSTPSTPSTPSSPLSNSSSASLSSVSSSEIDYEEEEDEGELTIEKIIDNQISEKISMDIAERDNMKLELEQLDPNSEEYRKLKEQIDDKEQFIQVLLATVGLEGESTEINPMLRRKDVKKKRRARGLATGVAITSTTTTIGTVGGAVVGGVTGFLLGFGVPGLVAGAAIGAGIGGAGGASVGLYATHSQMTKKPNHCVNCRVRFRKAVPGKIPYRCRCCWLFFCDRCVPHELLLETQTFRTITYPDEKDIRSNDPNYEPEESFDSQYIPLTHQQSKKSRSKISLFGKVQDVSQVSKAVKERRAYCSWCFKETLHLLSEKGYITRNVWNCQGCLNRTLRCRNPRCDAMARGLVGYDEEACWKCQKKIDSWETGSVSVENRVRNCYCSWCFELTEHDPICEASLIKIFKCRNCRNTTVPCSACHKGDGAAMARDNGFFWRGKCALHTKHIDSWDDYEENIRRSEITGAWCPYCVAKTTHVVMGPGGLLNRKTAFICKGCHQRTYRCGEKCEDSMARHARKKCLRCYLVDRAKKKPQTPTFEELLVTKDQIYSLNSQKQSIRYHLGRESFKKERNKATKEGYLRPFLLLVSMEPQMRVLTAATLGIDLIRRKCFGDPHAEAWEIIGHHNKGIIFRTRSASEEVLKVAKIKSTWYTTLRRSMRATMKTTTFKKVSASITQDACRNPDINVLPEMELEFLEKLAHWQHMMMSPEVMEIANQVMENKDFNDAMLPLEANGIGTAPIRRMLAEMFAEAQFSSDQQDDILVDHHSLHSNSVADLTENSESQSELQKKVHHGIGSTYSRKAKIVNYTAVSIPAAYMKLTVWFLVGTALALWLGPVGWAIEWGASLALGAIITTWIAGEMYLGPSHEVMTPAVVMICMQRITIAADGYDISEFMQSKNPEENENFDYEWSPEKEKESKVDM